MQIILSGSSVSPVNRYRRHYLGFCQSCMQYFSFYFPIYLQQGQHLACVPCLLEVVAAVLPPPGASALPSGGKSFPRLEP